MTLSPTPRPWVPSRAERRRYGVGQWWSFEPGGLARCPNCAGGLVRFSPGLRVCVRLDPRGRNTIASQRFGTAFPCPGCRFQLDVSLEPDLALVLRGAVA